MHQVMRCTLHTCGACDMSSVRRQTNDRVYGAVFDRHDKLMHPRSLPRMCVAQLTVQAVLTGIGNVHAIPYWAIQSLANAAQETEHA